MCDCEEEIIQIIIDSVSQNHITINPSSIKHYVNNGNVINIYITHDINIV